MAKHHPDLIFCRKQAGVGELVPCSLLFEWDGMRNWGLGGIHLLFRALVLGAPHFAPYSPWVFWKRAPVCGV